jgi:hypothetical protein
MFCSNCGEAIEQGQAFCKACGTPAAEAPTQIMTPAAEAPTQVMTPAPPAFAVTPPPPPPPVTVTPPPPPPPAPAAAAPGYGAGWQPPRGPVGRKSRAGLIWGIVVAVIVVLAGAGVGVYFALLRDGGDTTTTTKTLADSSTTTTGRTTSTGGRTTTTATGGTTAQTIPGLGSTTENTSTTEDLATAYLAATDALVMELEYDNERVRVLATEINNTAPNVPAAVRDELSTMMGMLDALNVELASLDVPAGFQKSYDYLEQAAMHMGNRIYATIQGIEEIWDAGKVSSSAVALFDEGRAERNEYQKAMKKYYDYLPIE